MIDLSGFGYLTPSCLFIDVTKSMIRLQNNIYFFYNKKERK